MRVDPGDINKILRNRRIGNALLGAGIGSLGGYFLDADNPYFPGAGALIGGAIGGFVHPGEITKHELNRNISFLRSIGIHDTNGPLPIKLDYNWTTPIIGSTALGAALAGGFSDNDWYTLAGFGGGLLAGGLLHNYLLKSTRLPKIVP